MIYLSAQPDEYFFLWQLQLQLFNFQKKGIPSNSIHVLIGYNEKIGLNPDFVIFSQEYGKYAQFYFYPDLRQNPLYVSSIRPHIIKQHIAAHPNLEHESLFYHDSDIIFERLPDFEKLQQQANIFFVSDTRSYLNAVYIHRAAGEQLFHDMCNVVGISPDLVKERDESVGGAQYLIPFSTPVFWDTVEKDAEALYGLMLRFNASQTTGSDHPGGKLKEIQAWCADMWSILWNIWKMGHHSAINDELAFTWPFDEIETKEKRNIFHNSGVTTKEPEKLFFKGKHYYYPPFYEDMSAYDSLKCTKQYTALIELFRIEKLYSNRTSMSEVTFLITIQETSELSEALLQLTLNYLCKYFDTNILVIGPCNLSLPDRDIRSNIRYASFEEVDSFLNLDSYLIENIYTPDICLWHTGNFGSPASIANATAILGNKEANMVLPYNKGAKIGNHPLLSVFSRFLDFEFLEMNQGKFDAISEYGSAGILFLKKTVLLQIAAHLERNILDSPELLNKWLSLNSLSPVYVNQEEAVYSFHHLLKQQA